MFKDIKIIEKEGGINPLKPIHTIGWKFGYKGNKYGNFISDQKHTGKFITYQSIDDEDNPYEVKQEIMKTVPLTPKDQILLLENMIEVMKKLNKGG